MVKQIIFNTIFQSNYIDKVKNYILLDEMV